MENGTKEVETGTKRQREVPWIIFGEGEQEPLAMLDGGINMTKRRVAIGVDVDMAMIMAMMEDTEEVTRGVMEEIMGVMEILEKAVEVMDILEVTLAMVVAMVHMVDKELREEACWVALEVEVWAVQGVVAGRPTRESDHGVRKPTR